MGLVVTRFAPSPTGHLHIGGARSALFCWAYANRARLDGHDGRFMIRIEDTDQARSSDESARGILEDLAWLGIEWDDGPELLVGRPSGAAHASERRATIGGDSRGVGPYFQARRRDLYDLYARQLVESGRAYPAFETPEELEAKRKEATAKKQTYRYDRAAYRAIPTPSARLAAMKEADSGGGGGRPYVVRFLAPAEAVIVHDEVLGDVTYGAGEMDDFVIRKADGFPTYHFAVVIDDELMGVTHVMRAQEHLNNTPRHVAMQAALKRHDTGTPFRTPLYAHMPLIFNMDGSKMSKRDKAKAARTAAKAAIQKGGATAPTLAAETGIAQAALDSFLAADSDSLDIAAALAKRFGLALPEIEVSDFREAGYLPEAIVNFIGLLGWSPGTKDEQGKDTEKFDMPFLASHFSVERIGKTNAKFDRVKLLAFNADYMKALPDAEFIRRWREWLAAYAPDAASNLDDRAMALLAPALKPRARTFAEALKSAEFALVADGVFAYDPKAVDKVLKKGEPAGLAVLSDLQPALAAVPSFEPATVHAALESFASSRGLEMGKIAQPLRVALTGSGVSPPIEATLAVLGRERALRRIERCLSECR